MSGENNASAGIKWLSAGGILFALGGIVAITKPVGFATSGAVGKCKQVTIVCRPAETAFFGVIYLCISAFLFYIAFRLARGK